MKSHKGNQKWNYTKEIKNEITQIKSKRNNLFDLPIEVKQIMHIENCNFNEVEEICKLVDEKTFFN